MRLKLDALERVVKKALYEEKGIDALRSEVKRVLGPTVLTDVPLEEVAKSANDLIDVMEHTGRINRLDFKASVVTKYLDHTHPQVRRFAARVVPQKFLSKMTNDRSTGVRAVVAARAQLDTVREMMKNFPSDDQLKTIYKKRLVVEGGLPKPEVQDEPFDMYGEKRLGDTVKQSTGPELSEQWYKDKAFKLMQDYGGALEYSWEEQAARNYARSAKAYSGVVVDEAKLLKAIKDIIEEKEELALKRDALKETLDYLERNDEAEMLQEATMPMLDETPDPVEALMSEGLGSKQFVERANEVFKVQQSSIPAGLRKYHLGEGTVPSEVPIVGIMPEGVSTVKCERALDEYCKQWSSRQSIVGEPIKLEWSYNPMQDRKVSFSAILR